MVTARDKAGLGAETEAIVMRAMVVILVAVLGVGSQVARGKERVLELTIDRAVELALDNSPRLRGAALDVAAAEAKRKQARAQYGPKLQFSLSAMYFNEPPSIGGNMPSMNTGDVNITDELTQLDDLIQLIGDDADRAISAGLLGVGQGLQGIIDTFANLDSLFASKKYDVTLTARVVQPLTPLWAIHQMAELAGLEVDVARVALERQRIELAYQVREVCLRLLQAQAGLSALDEAVASVQAHIERAQHFLDAGLIGRNDLLQAEVRLADLKGKRLEARHGIELALATLAMLLDLPADQEIHLQAPGAEPVRAALPQLADAQAEAAASRPELRELNLRIQQAERGVKASWQGFIPSVSAMGQYQHNEGSIMVPPAWTGGVVVDFNVWEWGASYYATEEAEAGLARARVGREELARGIDLQVRTAWLKIKETAEKIEIARSAVAQAEEQLRLEQQRYEVQQAASTDVLDAQTRLTQARVTADSAAIERRIAFAALDKAIGREPRAPRGASPQATPTEANPEGSSPK